MAQLQLRLNSCPHNHNETEARVKRNSFKWNLRTIFWNCLVSAKAPLKRVCCFSQSLPVSAV